MTEEERKIIAIREEMVATKVGEGLNRAKFKSAPKMPMFFDDVSTNESEVWFTWNGRRYRMMVEEMTAPDSERESHEYRATGSPK